MITKNSMQLKALIKKEAAEKQAEADVIKAENAAAEKVRTDAIEAKEFAREIAEAKAEREREALRIERQAELNAAARDERRLKQAIGAAQNSLSVGDLSAAKRQLEKSVPTSPGNVSGAFSDASGCALGRPRCPLGKLRSLLAASWSVPEHCGSAPDHLGGAPEASKPILVRFLLGLDSMLV